MKLKQVVESLESYGKRKEDKSKRTIRDERPSQKSLKLETTSKTRSVKKKLQLTEVDIADPRELNDSINPESSSQYSHQGSGDLGSPTLYTFKDSMIDQSFPSEAHGMAKIFKNKTKAERILLRLPSISNFVEEAPSSLNIDELREALIFSFFKLMRKHLHNAAYRFFLSNRHLFAEALSKFCKSGNYKELLQEVENKYKVESIVESFNQEGRRQQDEHSGRGFSRRQGSQSYREGPALSSPASPLRQRTFVWRPSLFSKASRVF